MAATISRLLARVWPPTGRHRGGRPARDDLPTAVMPPVSVPVPAEYAHVEDLHLMPARERAYWVRVLNESARLLRR